MNPSRRAWVVAALPVLAVLVLDPGGLSPFGPAKWAVVPALVLAGAAVLPGRARTVVLERSTLWAWAALLAVVAVAALVGVDPLYAWLGTPERRFGALTWLLCFLAFAAGQQLDEDDARFVVAAAVATVAVLGLWAAAEQLGWDPVPLTGAGPRPVGTLGSSAYLGAAAALLVPVAAGVALDRRWRRPAQRAAWVAAAAGTVALVVSGARAAWLGAVLAAGVAFVARRRRIVHPGRIAAAMAGATLAVVALGLASGAGGRLGSAMSDRDGGPRGRLDEWRVAARAAAEHPLTGVGPEGYRVVFGGVVDDDYEQAHGRRPLPDRAHSAPLDVAVTTGLPGLAAYGALVLALGRFARRALRTAPAWVAGVAAGLVAYAAQSLFLFPVAELDPVAWLLAGVLVSRVVRPAERVARRPVRAVALVAGALAVAAVAAGALDVVADRTARRTLEAVAADRPTDATAAARLRPDAVRYRLVAVRALEGGAAAGSHRRTMAQLDRAADLSPRDPVVASERARVLLNRARLTGLAADVDGARAVLEALARRDPRNAETLLRLGLVRALDDDAGGAERAWLEAERLAPRSSAGSTNLALAYADTGRWDEARDAAERALERNPSDQRARSVLDRADAAEAPG